MNAPTPLHLLAAAPGALPHAHDRIREIPYNYTSFSDREIVIRLLGARVGRHPFRSSTTGHCLTRSPSGNSSISLIGFGPPLETPPLNPDVDTSSGIVPQLFHDPMASPPGERVRLPRDADTGYDSHRRAYGWAPYPALTTVGHTTDGDIWLIDHGAALYFHHDWPARGSAAQRPYPAAAEHVLLPDAGPLDRKSVV